MAGFSWSAPGMTREADPAAVQSRFQFQRQYRSPLQGGQGALAGQNQLGIATQQALGSVAQIMQQRKNDQIAQTFLNDKAQGGDPLAQKIMAMKLPPQVAWNTFQQQQNQGQEGEQIRLKNALMQAQVDKLNAPDDMVDTPYGRMNPYQWAQISNKGSNPVDDLKQDMYKKLGVMPDQIIGTPSNVDAQGKPWTANSKGRPYISVQTSDGRTVSAPGDEMQGFLNRSRTINPSQWQKDAAASFQAQSMQPNSAAGALSGPGQLPQIVNQTDYDALPAGASYIGASGRKYIKPGAPTTSAGSSQTVPFSGTPDNSD